MASIYQHLLNAFFKSDNHVLNQNELCILRPYIESLKFKLNDTSERSSEAPSISY